MPCGGAVVSCRALGGGHDPAGLSVRRRTRNDIRGLPG
ncbi:hypothetical protein T261_8013 [Streptomyces lydicus]|nr:hypothetical protein T261_8013 [Streptomyces lydicus]